MALPGVLMALAVPMVVKVLAALGIGFATYTGADLLISSAETYVLNQFDNLPTDAYEILAMMGVITGIKMLFAAYVANLGVKTTLGALTRVKIG